MLRFFLFRQFRILRNDVPVDLPARTKTQALLAYLLLHRQQPLLRDRVAFALWTDETEQTARANLRRHLYNLRQALPDVEMLWTMTGRRTIEACHDASYWLDVAEFETASQTPATWRQAVSLYKEDLLADVDDDWIFYERERLRELHLKNLTQLIVYEQQQGNYLHAISYAQQLHGAAPAHPALPR